MRVQTSCQVFVSLAETDYLVSAYNQECSIFFHPYLFLVAFLQFAFFFHGRAPNSQQLLVIRVNL